MAPHSPASRNQPSPPPSNGGGLVFQSDDPSAIKLECQRALTAFQHGNHAEALSLISEASQRHENHALVHHCQATIHAKVAEITDDETAKQRNLRSGIDSARRACFLSPNSVEFAYLLANLLLKDAQYLEVVEECERALAVENPVDPAKESLQEEQKIPTAQGRIGSVHRELKSLIQEANIASISAWMKNSGSGEGEEKIRLVPIRRLPESAEELEERWTEIDVGVPGAGVLQKKSDSQVESTLPNFNSGGADDFNVNKLAKLQADLERFLEESSSGFSEGDNGSSFLPCN